MRRRVFTSCSMYAVALVLLTVAPNAPVAAQGVASGADRPYVVEYYYKVRWGSADEFIRLFRKNHLPVLRRLQELGRIVQLSAAAPRFHATEDGRWDYRVTITWKNIGVTNDGFDEDAIKRQLFPDQETYGREEQRRFEILLAHWDLPIQDVSLEP